MTKPAEHKEQPNAPLWGALFGPLFWWYLAGYALMGVIGITWCGLGKAVIPFIAGIGVSLFYAGHQAVMLNRLLGKTPKRWHIVVASILRFGCTAFIIVWLAQGRISTAGWILLGFFGQHVALLGSQIWMAIQNARHMSG